MTRKKFCPGNDRYWDGFLRGGIQKAVKLYKTGQYSIKEIEELTGVKKSTLYRNL